MRRRHRPRREVAFSFDSFLDLVANVVGIVLRLILVAWVGARSYKAMVTPAPLPPTPALAQPAERPEPNDPRSGLIAAEREAAARVRLETRESEQALLVARKVADSLGEELRALKEARPVRAVGVSPEGGPGGERAAPSIGEMARRTAARQVTLERVRGQSKASQRVLYPAPISQETQEDEAMFEVREGRVTLLDVGALAKLIRAGADGKADRLREAWSVTEETAAVGAFRARYTLERERGPLDSGAGAPPEGPYRYGVTGWVAVPIGEERGEPVGDALAEGSAFRRLVDAFDPAQTVVTLWVYPDSFPAYRRLRDYLHDRGLVVAGRPLPQGEPIGASRQGTASRGQ